MPPPSMECGRIEKRRRGKVVEVLSHFDWPSRRTVSDAMEPNKRHTEKVYCCRGNIFLREMVHIL